MAPHGDGAVGHLPYACGPPRVVGWPEELDVKAEPAAAGGATHAQTWIQAGAAARAVPKAAVAPSLVDKLSALAGKSKDALRFDAPGAPGWRAST